MHSHFRHSTNAQGASSGRAFSLIELMVVIGIIALLAALLFPLFGRARAKARQTTCVSNFRQIGASMLLYAQDYDETLVPDRNGPSPDRRGPIGYIWPQILFPYVKSWQVFTCPEDPNANDAFYLAHMQFPSNPDRYTLTWARAFSTDFGYNRHLSWSGGRLAKVTRPASTILGTDSSEGVAYDNNRDAGSYYVDGPDQFTWTPNGPIIDYGKVAPRHFDRANTAFLDGHVKAMTIADLMAGYDQNTRSITNQDLFLWNLP